VRDIDIVNTNNTMLGDVSLVYNTIALYS